MLNGLVIVDVMRAWDLVFVDAACCFVCLLVRSVWVVVSVLNGLPKGNSFPVFSLGAEEEEPVHSVVRKQSWP